LESDINLFFHHLTVVFKSLTVLVNTMDRLMLLLNVLIVLLIPLIVMTAYAIFVTGSEASQNGYCDINIESKEDIERPPKENANSQVCEFFEKDLQGDLDNAYGNVPMEVFKHKLDYVLQYNPSLETFLDTESERYSLTEEAKQEVYALIDEDSYKNTVDNIHNWIQNNIEYEKNYKWYTAQETWENRRANCNGISFLTCGMMREVGIPCKVVASREHAWTEYLYVDEMGRMIWSVWDQGLSGYSVLSANVYEYDLN